MKVVKIKNPDELVASMNYPKSMDAVNINDPDACYTQDATGTLRPLNGFYKGAPILFKFHESDILPVLS